ncbi:glycogen/starch/alpha-glucan phosphorylase [Microbacterium sp. EYE_5]|uniref:glycogen/starch/alpha-glucan phosphorylase n=1 Tax=unclassified Microbacterium TaxID=2609290 RepID=UPI002003BEF1|nr:MULTISPECIES: glycogen/starch/alpha-glucan phosphorylase [unclassified Microbacterium]MCK6080416.1 glycogen/starch/alpha-glucan phosphorylase [Microbacterium sp. EYE_382]MCK6085687.1 glycogen/starch/alpha-glucan phosphorylase [Microbacterium sp. EYE_384]MCK6124815.1 glycogen/starch/alpha-glucan phosphorylase [Microbacterium sp. EYE_80]MCK6127724.1 glycogen/starch/alpha-glucan phosphorylase [Microbacterium sp. EYE_79]MCK6141371.1 glycogen/starch/alpha-glucan phosphorylase [Microbacterium sp.
MNARTPSRLQPTHPLATAPVRAPEATVDGFVAQFLENLNNGRGVALSTSTANDRYFALAVTVRDYLMARWLEDVRRQRSEQSKGVAYLSAEYLLGRQLDNNLLATGLGDIAGEALAACGLDIDDVRALEIEPGLGNGGLGRLAACFIDSLATLGVPSVGYGIRYEYGIFRQTFVDGQQVEQADSWLALGSPWEFPHPEAAQTISFGGHTETYDDEGVTRSRWIPAWNVQAVPHNYMVPGYHNGRVNTLRLWSAQATQGFDLRVFNAGDYQEAVRAQTYAENISKVLYPEDSTPQGKELRLQQQYFFVAASISDFVNLILPRDFDMADLPTRVIFQLNDTHPVIGVPELMRVLVDERKLQWDAAWAITQQCFAYTCHTLLPEALEVWPADLLGRLLPRHLEIIYRINDEFLDAVRERFGDDGDRIRRMSIIAPDGAVRMAYLATVAGAKVNGVAELHSQLLREKVLPDFDEFYPEKFTNVTNGVTPRRFIRLANPSLSRLITDTIGAGWLTDLDRLRELEDYADDAEFRAAFRSVKAANKRALARTLADRDGLTVADDHLLDVMVKRLHEYKRQTLKLLHIITEYDAIASGRVAAADVTPRTFVFGAKAAPGYAMAKRIIHLINAVGSVVNADPRVEGRLAVLFPPNYNVTLAERVVPAADLSEQISLAGKEASGTGNMKFALNGALTIGTDDGANVEIRELVGDENFFLFGMSEPEVADLSAQGYHPIDFVRADENLARSLDLISSGAFSGGDGSVFEPVVTNLLHHDPFMALADYTSYIDAQRRVDAMYADQDAWTRAAILNVARSGFFSSDRSMRDYIDRIWHTPPVV